MFGLAGRPFPFADAKILVQKTNISLSPRKLVALICVIRWQRKTKCAAFSDITFHPDMTAVSLDQDFADIETQAYP